MKHQRFSDIVELLDPNSVLVRNNTKVIPARIFGIKDTGGKCELLLIKQHQVSDAGCVWECLSKPGLKPGQTVTFPGSDLQGVCREITGFTRLIEFNQNHAQFLQSLHQIGHTPIPPYIHWEKDDEEQLRQVYQTTYAKISGSAAAPTAGLHFTPELDEKLRQKGIIIEEVTLHVGLGTFQPVQDEQLKSKTLHHEYYQLTAETAERLNQAKAAGKKIVSVGTTTTRVLETCSQSGQLQPGEGETDLFIQPGYQFHCVDQLITNFHLPESSLLMLISAFVSEPNTTLSFTDFAHSSVGQAYQVAIQEQYRFFSFGDAMFIC
jgi:S-adenosylmethionine:tRNA ribosyltransferase-isomerase